MSYNVEIITSKAMYINRKTVKNSKKILIYFIIENSVQLVQNNFKKKEEDYNEFNKWINTSLYR